MADSWNWAGMMNRETSIYSSDTLVVRDRRQSRRWVIIGAVVALVLVAVLIAMMMGRSATQTKEQAAAR